MSCGWTNCSLFHMPLRAKSNPSRAPSRGSAQKFFHKLFIANGGDFSRSGGSSMYLRKKLNTSEPVGNNRDIVYIFVDMPMDEKSSDCMAFIAPSLLSVFCVARASTFCR